MNNNDDKYFLHSDETTEMEILEQYYYIHYYDIDDDGNYLYNEDISFIRDKDLYELIEDMEELDKYDLSRRY